MISFKLKALEKMTEKLFISPQETTAETIKLEEQKKGKTGIKFLTPNKLLTRLL